MRPPPMAKELFAAALLLGLAVGLPGCHRGEVGSAAQVAPAPAGEPVVLAVYQPWFGEKEHIDVGYSSGDRAVQERQVEEARQRGIHGFLVDWYGPGKKAMDEVFRSLQQVAGERDFTVALLYEEKLDTGPASTEAAIRELRYAYDNYIGPQAPYRDAYLTYQGRPVVFIFPKGGRTDWKRVRQSLAAWEQAPLLIYEDTENHRFDDQFDGYFAWVKPGPEGWAADGGDWGGDYLQDFYRRMSRRPGKLVAGAAWPGFDDGRASWSQGRRMDARCGRTFDDTLRAFRRYHSDRNPLPFLLVVTWNDYEEGTAIERGVETCAQAAD